MALDQRLQALGHAFMEALTCLLLAFRTSLHPAVALRSSCLCLLMFGLVTWLYIAQYEAIFIASGAIALAVCLGASILGLLPAVTPGGGGGLISVSTAFLSTIAAIGIYVAVFIPIIATAIYIILIVFGIRMSLSWMLMSSLRERTLKHYPSLTQRTISTGPISKTIRYMLTPWLAFGSAPLLYLLIPFVNGIVLLILLAYLNVRFLTPSAFKGVANSSEQLHAIRQQRSATIFFGLMIFGVACVPVLNLLLPALLGTGTCHLSYRGLNRTLPMTGTTDKGQVSLPSP